MLRKRKNRKTAGERAKNRKKMVKTKYGQRPFRHSKKGVSSCILASFAFVILIGMLIISFHFKGDMNILAGFVSIAVLVMAGRGLYMAVKGFKERERNYITCKVGIGLNIFLLLMMILIFIRGLL